MAIKQFTFSFKLNAQDLFEFVAQKNVAMNIGIYGDEPRKPKLPKQLSAPPPMLALPPPRGKRGHPSVIQIVLAMLARDPKAKLPFTAIQEYTVAAGFSKDSAHSQLWTMRQRGLAKQAGKGFYRITAKGLKEANHGN